MSPNRFQHLLELVRLLLTKKDTKMRKATTAEERLAVTLFGNGRFPVVSELLI